jgi:aspartate/methionine/tyrosine aminotransferase
MRLETFALERYQSIWENRVAWNLSESGVHPLSLGELVDDAEVDASLRDLPLGYPQTNGTVALRERIAAMYPGATPEHVQVTNGGSEANCIVLMRLVEPGDEIVVMMPNYMQVPGLARALGATVRPWWLRETGGGDLARWVPDPNELNELVTDRTRAIVVCNPNNPTGARIDAVFVEAVCRAAARVGAWVIGDEIYRGAERLAADTPSVWDRGYERAIVTSGLSKAYGLPGLRIGWVIGPRDLMDDLWAVHDYTSIAPGALNDRLAQIALAPRTRERILARTRSIVRANYNLVRQWIEQQDGLLHAAPAAGAIAFLRYTHPIASSELADRLREEESVLVLPGAHFEMEGYLRIGFGAEPDYLSAALSRVAAVLRKVGARAR